MVKIYPSDPPGTQWLKQARQRDDPEDMFSPEENLARNKRWTKPGPYVTQLSPGEEAEFRQWMTDMHAGKRMAGDPAQYLSPTSPYDMRGFWRAMKGGDPRAQTGVNPFDQQIHFPDIWKTPYASTFSDESIYAIPGQTPQWRDNLYQMPGGQVIYDDYMGKWLGIPGERR